jgi:hypothetical protein
MLGIRAADSAAGAEVGHIAHLDAARHQLVTGSLDVGDNQELVLGRARRGERAVRTELD